MEFVLLPDHPGGPAIAAKLAARNFRRTIPHRSGRPWIVGNWSEADIVLASAGANRLAVLGRSGISADALVARLHHVRSVRDLDAIAKTQHGTVHLIASIDGDLRAQGSLSTRCQVFHATVDGIAVGADRPQILATLAGSGIDEELLAAQILCPDRPWPLSDRCAWRGVQSPPCGHYLEIISNGTAHHVPWWTAPEPDVSLAAGADLLRESLAAAVDARTAGGGTVSADLSGGMDSTSLCFLASRSADSLMTTHYASLDPTNDDHRWADECAGQLSVARHIVIPRGSAPGWYQDSTAVDPDTEGPFRFVRTRATTEHLARLVASAGSTRHLQGTGGDELFWPQLLTLQALARRYPLKAIPHIRAAKSLGRWSLVTTARNLTRQTSYSRWLATAADQLGLPRSEASDPDWESLPKMPPWATPDAVDAARTLMSLAAKQDPQPLAEPTVQHEMLRLMQVNGNATRQASRVTSRMGVSIEAPFLDDRVIEVAMSIRFDERMAVGKYKPLLAAAMRGIVPDHALERKTKGDYSADLFSGLRRHRRELIEHLCDDSNLTRLGLVDRDSLRAVLLGLHPDTRPLMPLDATLACESWLRSVSRMAETTPATPNCQDRRQEHGLRIGT